MQGHILGTYVFGDIVAAARIRAAENQQRSNDCVTDIFDGWHVFHDFPLIEIKMEYPCDINANVVPPAKAPGRTASRQSNGFGILFARSGIWPLPAASGACPARNGGVPAGNDSRSRADRATAHRTLMVPIGHRCATMIPLRCTRTTPRSAPRRQTPAHLLAYTACIACRYSGIGTGSALSPAW